MRVALFVLVGGCCAVPADDPLAEGTWGGDPDPHALTVRADGTGSLDLDCFGGSSVGTIEVRDGRVDGTFSFDPDSWGPDTPEEHDPFDVVLTGTVCGRRLVATATGDGEWVDVVDLDLRLGRDRGFGAGCAQ